MELGYPHPDQLLKELTSEQLTEWMAFNLIDPIGKWRDDYRMSYMAATISNNFIKAFGKKGAKFHSVDDFVLPWQPKKKREMTQQQLTESLLAWANAHNKAVERQERTKNKPPKK